MNKIWRKPLHKRKVWKEMTLPQKTLYYMGPFLEHFVDVWLQPLPFPTIVKCAYSLVLIVFILFPLVYPITILLIYWTAMQYFLESSLDMRYPEHLDILHSVEKVFDMPMTNKQCELLILTYMEQCRYIAAACASFVDYVRLASSMLFA